MTAKPILRWYSPSQDVITGNYVIGCYADATGGIANVTLSGDCASSVNATASLYTDTDANGGSRSRWGYWWTLDGAAFAAASASGSAYLYAKATANDGTMQARVIGGAPGDGNSPRTDMQIFPRSGSYDWVKTIGLGGDYATWDLMTAALATVQSGGGAKRPRITFITTAVYTMTNGGASSCTGHDAYCDVDAGVGVIATIKCGTSFDPTRTTNNWTWRAGVSQIHFKGAGIKIDRQYFSAINTPDSRPCWFDGITVTNGIGTDDTFYWNGDEPGEFLVTQNGSGSSKFPFVNDCNISYVSFLSGASIYNGNLAYRPGVGRVFSSPMRVGNYVYGATCEWWRPAVFAPLLMLTYSGSATTATAKLYSQTAASGNPKIELYENGSLVQTFIIVNDGVYTAGQNMKPSELSGSITTWSAGRAGGLANNWTVSAVASDATSLWCRFLDGSETGSATTLDVKAGPKIATLQSSIHSEWGQFAGDENVVLIANVLRACFYSSSQVNVGSLIDAVIDDNIFDPVGSAVFTAGSMNFPNCQHLLLRNNLIGESLVNTGNCDAYSISLQNIILGSPGNVGSVWNWSYNVTIGSITTSVGTANHTVADEAAFTALFRDRTSGDYRPAVASALLGWVDPPATLRDVFNVARNNPDVRGAWGAEAPAHTYPF